MLVKVGGIDDVYLNTGDYVEINVLPNCAK